MSNTLFFQKKLQVIICVIGGVCFFFLMFFVIRKDQYPGSVFIGDTEYHLEIAKTQEDQQKGLGERDVLCQECAMLFVFDWPQKQGFWMKGMRFPLDIIWLLDDTVVFLEHDIPPDSQKVFFPDARANRVLEVNGGIAKDVQVGDKLIFSQDVEEKKR